MLTVTGATTVNPPVSVALVPPEFVTVTFRAPRAAPPAMESVAVSCVAEPTATFVTPMPAPLRLTVAPAANPEPLIVTGTVAPCPP